jgi:hypothetical protein
MPFLLLILGGLKSAVGFIGGWLSRRSLTEIACIALALLCLVQFVTIRGEKRHSAKLAALVKCEAARKADRTAYERAQTDAAAKNKAEVAAKEAQSQRISDNAKTAYARDLAELRRLRSNSTPARPSGHSGSSKDCPATGGADADGLRLSADEHLQASEIELRLMYLQNWVIDQLKAQ